MWLTRVPAEAAGHVFGLLAPLDVLEQLCAQADRDWRSFLVARASDCVGVAGWWCWSPARPNSSPLARSL
jgi:hypothetical protein